jgi:ABC-type multidrug transport system ATPase subunit
MTESMDDGLAPADASQTDALVRLADVVCRARHGDALRRLSLSVSEGERIALFGPDSCGKTLVLRLLTGDARPDAGEVTIRGEPPSRSPVRVAMVLDEPQHAGRLTVRDRLMWRMARQGLPPLQRAARVAEAMELLDLEPARDVPERELSRSRRVALDIAGAVACDPALLLLDNVTAGLPEPLAARLFAYLDGRRAADGLTLVHATTSSAEAESADRVAVLVEGAVAACEAPAALLRRLATDRVTIETDNPDEVQRTARGIFHVEILESPRRIRFAARDPLEVAAQAMRHAASGASVVHIRRGTLWDAYARIAADRRATQA